MQVEVEGVERGGKGDWMKAETEGNNLIKKYRNERQNY
jgi:hypothetical protein